jgi:hypothetical protein
LSQVPYNKNQRVQINSIRLVYNYCIFLFTVSLREVRASKRCFLFIIVRMIYLRILQLMPLWQFISRFFKQNHIDKHCIIFQVLLPIWSCLIRWAR